MKLEDPGEFMFAFEDGMKAASDMTREELLHVIAYLMKERDWWKSEAMAATGRPIVFR